MHGEIQRQPKRVIRELRQLHDGLAEPVAAPQYSALTMRRVNMYLIYLLSPNAGGDNLPE
jgi:hypothetical protein